MKKVLLTSLALVAGAALVHAQGTISLQESGTGTVVTNGVSIGGTVGNAASGYFYDVLDMTQTSWANLTLAQQAVFATGGSGLLVNPTDISLWTDSGVTGAAASVTKGGITGLGGSTGNSAANWAAPTSDLTPGGDPSAYYTAPNYDYYIVIGWSSNLGSSWSAVSTAINNNTLPTSGWFGETKALYNYAGGSGLGAVNVFSPQTTTSLPGSGVGAAAVNPELVLLPVPEPTTLALAGLGGLSMLFLRRRKS